MNEREKTSTLRSDLTTNTAASTAAPRRRGAAAASATASVAAAPHSVACSTMLLRNWYPEPGDFCVPGESM